jgi:hypothetical protein
MQMAPLWRYVGTVGFSFHTKNTSKAASEYFDKIIDSACLNR